jgi:hypothetical protein
MTDFPPFVPHLLIRTGHQQTVFSQFIPGQLRPYAAEQHVVDLDDGDRIVLHDDCPSGWTAGDRAALLLHGVAGCHGSPYLVRLAGKLNDRGVRTFRMDMRSCGAGMKMAQHPGHAGRSEDARAASLAIRELCPESPLTMVGFSMGGHIVLKLACEVGDQPPGNLDSTIAVAPPIDLVCCGENIDRGFNCVYSRKFARMLVRFVKERREFIPAIKDIRLSPAPTSIVSFDDLVTAPLSGFRDVTDYYRQCSSLPHMSKVKLPTLIITSRDDPVIPIEMFERAKLSPTTEFHVTSHGGHVAFFGQRGIDPDRWWVDWRIADWIEGQDEESMAASDSQHRNGSLRV